jgi:N-methylhydantoinase B
VIFTRWALRPDSGGPGKHRGGLGAVYEIELLEEEADVFLFGERGRFAPPGVVGGKPAAKNRFLFDGGKEPPMTSKMVGLKLRRGERLHLETPGGGGYGAPQERAREAVERDLALGYVTPEGAARDYPPRGGEGSR